MYRYKQLFYRPSDCPIIWLAPRAAPQETVVFQLRASAPEFVMPSSTPSVSAQEFKAMCAHHV